MSGYNSKIYTGGAIPDQGSNGLPLEIADADLPTQLVAAPKMGLGTSLNYSPHAVEANFITPSNAYPVKNAAPVKAQKFVPTPPPAPPALWRTVLRSIVSGSVKEGTTYAATGDYSTSGSAGGINTPGGGGGGLGPGSQGIGGGANTQPGSTGSR